MKVTDVNKLNDTFKVGDVVWGCEFAYNEQKENANKTQRPIKGILSSFRYEKDYMANKNNSMGFINYFIPLKNDGKTPSWQKAIKAYSLKYASTEDECKEIYNDIINKNIKWHKNEIGRLKKELLN